MLRCSNPECESRHEETPMFNISVTVYADFDVAEPIRKIALKHFTCVYCHNEAEEAEEEGE